MAFQIKDFASISASIVNFLKATTTKVTDFNIGSVTRSLVEAPAIEIEELYLQMFHGLREAIPVSLYNSMDFDALDATAASGLVRVILTSSTAPVTIPAGTVFSVASMPVAYVSIADATLAASNTFIDIAVAAQISGTAGNAPANLSFALQPVPAGFVSAINAAPIANGTNAETDADRKVRFNAYIRSLSRGTVSALAYGLGTTRLYDANGNLTERVQSTAIIEPYVADNTQPVGLVNCYIHNGVGGTTGALVNAARQIVYGYYDSKGVAVPGWKAAGVNVQVFAAAEQLVNFAGALTIAAGYDVTTVRALAVSAVSSYIQGLPIGATAIRAEMVAAVMALDGVINILPSLPAGDVTATASTKLMPGSMTFS